MPTSASQCSASVSKKKNKKKPRDSGSNCDSKNKLCASEPGSSQCIPPANTPMSTSAATSKRKINKNPAPPADTPPADPPPADPPPADALMFTSASPSKKKNIKKPRDSGSNCDSKNKLCASEPGSSQCTSPADTLPADAPLSTSAATSKKKINKRPAPPADTPPADTLKSTSAATSKKKINKKPAPPADTPMSTSAATSKRKINKKPAPPADTPPADPPPVDTLMSTSASPPKKKNKKKPRNSGSNCDSKNKLCASEPGSSQCTPPADAPLSTSAATSKKKINKKPAPPADTPMSTSAATSKRKINKKPAPPADTPPADPPPVDTLMSTSASPPKKKNKKKPRNSGSNCDSKNKLCASEPGSSQCTPPADTPPADAPLSTSAATSKRKINKKPAPPADTPPADTPPADTPPRDVKVGSSPLGKAGIGPDSILCYAEQADVELNLEGATFVAEDVSNKLRQVISDTARQTALLMRTRVRCLDVYDVTNIMEPRFETQFTTFGKENFITYVDITLDLHNLTLTPQKCEYATLLNVSIDGTTGEESPNISEPLRDYFTKVVLAILTPEKKLNAIVAEDLRTNTAIGPIFPNFFDLAVVVLKDDNLNAFGLFARQPMQWQTSVKPHAEAIKEVEVEPMQSHVLDMVDALCSNPSGADINIQQQFQNLFPIMVNNIMRNEWKSDRTVDIISKITRTWPSCSKIGKSLLLTYLSHSTNDWLTVPMIKCAMALGRQATFEFLDTNDYLERIHNCFMEGMWSQLQADLWSTMLDVATVLLRSEPTMELEDYVACDYAMYDLIGDSIAPRRTIFPESKPKPAEGGESTTDDQKENTTDGRRLKIRILPPTHRNRTGLHKETIFEPTRFSPNKCIKFNIRNCGTKIIPSRYQPPVLQNGGTNHVVVAGGLLQRFKCKSNKSNPAPIFGAISL